MVLDVLVNITVVAAIGFIVAAALTSHIATFYVVKSSSMEPTLLVGDHVVVVRFLYRLARPKRGDVVVLTAPAAPASRRATPGRDLIKRVAGIPGDTLVRGQRHGRRPQEAVVQKTVPRGTILVLGDNREVSRDSSTFGVVDERLLVGRALAIAWPPTRMRRLRRPTTPAADRFDAPVQVELG